MKYVDGRAVILGDKVDLGSGWSGVVAVIDTDQYSERYPASNWAYLQEGAMVETSQGGLIHMVNDWLDFTLVSREGD